MTARALFGLIVGWCLLTNPVLAMPARKRCHVLGNALKTLSDSAKKAPRVSNLDGSRIHTTGEYIAGISKNPRWNRFALKIQETRKIYAVKLRDQNRYYHLHKNDPGFWGRPPNFGYLRMKRNAPHMAGRTIQETFNKFYPGQDYAMVIEGSKKVLITPANKVLGKEYVEIVYDVSGNYFRLRKGIFRGGKYLEFISDNKQYTNWAGEIVDMGPLGKFEKQKFLDSSHWNALIE